MPEGGRVWWATSPRNSLIIGILGVNLSANQEEQSLNEQGTCPRCQSVLVIGGQESLIYGKQDLLTLFSSNLINSFTNINIFSGGGG